MGATLGVNERTVRRWRTEGLLAEATVVVLRRTIVYDLDKVFECLQTQALNAQKESEELTREDMKTTRLINRIILGIGIFIALLIIAAPMEELTTAQFVTAKAGGAIFAYALGGIAADKHDRNEI